MKVAVIGTGFVGVVTSAVFASAGNEVWGVDIDEIKVKSLSQGKVPFYEPGLETLLQKSLADGTLKFTTHYQEAVTDAEVIMIAVGTPSAKDGTVDLRFVFAAAESMAPYLAKKAIVAIKSTVPPGTNDLVREKIDALNPQEFVVASLPEFLKEGSAVDDTLKPDRVVIGASEKWAVKKLLDLHAHLGGQRVVVSAESAQMAKYTANAYLAQRITFINQIANLCEKNGARISEVVQAIGFDKRIGSHYWYPGLGYGGSCFPKDVKELAAYSKSVGEGTGLLVKIDELNEERIGKKMKEYAQTVGGFAGKQVAVLGLSFKPNTNDMRFAPSLEVVPYLTKNGAKVMAYDPKAMDEAILHFPGISLAQDPYQACSGAEVIFLLVEWNELKHLDIGRLKDITKEACVFIDTRNQYSEAAMTEAGFVYVGIGNG